jgi:hypothetical protein
MDFLAGSFLSPFEWEQLSYSDNLPEGVLRWELNLLLRKYQIGVMR